MTQRRNEQTEIEDMRPTAWKADGTPTRFEIVQHEPRPQPRVIGADDDMQHIVSPIPPERAPRVQYVVTGSPIDEARAFNHRTNNLAIIIAAGSVLIAVRFGATLTAWTGIMTFGAIYAACWLIAYVVDVLRSPGGIELFHAWSLWSFLRREQDHRHNRTQRSTASIIAQAIVGGTAFFFLFVAIILVAEIWMQR